MRNRWSFLLRVLSPRISSVPASAILINVPLYFCDLNFIVAAHQGPGAYKDHLRELVTRGEVTFVLSPMHWVEAAEDDDAARGDDKADFMDSLNARWLYDRRGIQRKEVHAAFFRFLGVPTDAPQVVATMRDVIADLTGQAAERNSRDFVRHVREIGRNHPLEQNLQQAFETSRLNGQRFRSRRLTPAFLRRIERLYVRQLLPNTTPAGVIIDQGSKTTFLSGYQLTDLPAFSIETRVTHDTWQQARQLNRNNFVDQEHLMALPYVHFFITDDARLGALITRISAGLPFPIATVLTKAEFDLRYPLQTPTTLNGH